MNDSLLGQQLDEYRLESLLGRGGMARVYRGLDTRLGRYVAIKVIDTPLRADSEYAARFEREAQAIAKLEHPHIVRLYRYGEAQGVLYMAMQYVEGSDLGFVLQTYQDDGEFIEPDEARRMIREVCQALDYAHSRGIIHRDVKPTNILLDNQGQAYLTDFGLALLIEIGTRGEIFGSPHYIAPEQAISSAKVVPQSDLYSVGIILYEMFTGQLPFDADTSLDIAMLHMSDPPRPPRELRPEISPQLENVILKTLAKEPAERYPTGAALADALDRALVRQAPTPAASTPSRKSIPERVALDVLAQPLPPPPAEVTPPAGPPTRPAPAPPPMVAPPPAFPTRPKRQTSPSLMLLAGIGLGVLVLLAAAIVGLYLLLGGNGDQSEPVPTTSIVALIAGNETPTLAETATFMPIPSETWPPTFTPLSLPAIMATVTSAPLAAPTIAPTPFPTLTPTPTLTPAPTITSSPTVMVERPGDYEILIAKRREDSLLVVNQGDSAFPLASLRLGEGEGAINGSEWDVEALEPGQCVAVRKDGGNPKLPDVECELVGERLTRDGPRRFWKSTFTIFYSQWEFDCRSERCPITIPE